MSNRILRESICTSETIAAVSWLEEVLFYRLMVTCDDYGRFDGRPAVIRGRAFPIAPVCEEQIQAALEHLAEAGLICLYQVEGRPYLQLTTWEKHQRVRTKRSKYPAPITAPVSSEEDRGQQPAAESSICCHLSADAGLNPNPDPNPNPNPNPDPPLSPQGEAQAQGDQDRDRKRERARGDKGSERPKDREESDALLADFQGELGQKLKEWMAYKAERRESYRPTGLKNLLSEVKNKQRQYPDGQICALIGECMANNWKGIIWDKLKEEKYGREPGAGDCRHQDAGGGYDLSGIFRV